MFFFCFLTHCVGYLSYLDTGITQAFTQSTRAIMSDKKTPLRCFDAEGLVYMPVFQLDATGGESGR